MARAFGGFNSTLVRLKGGAVGSVGDEVACFNSTLVRLKEGGIRSRHVRPWCVSIPHWFD